ncbi:MAG: TIGR03016 family PEP-CTERM system-associated outer membrane protein [Burkholderiaceae bacterium]|nr:TIGR03016 family PEP-CTERM system-associated outer membrane protein [Burkholderiaceae bacterium]
MRSKKLERVVAVGDGLGRQLGLLGRLSACALGALACASQPVQAQDAGSSARGFNLAPRLTSSATISNDINRQGDGAADGALILQLSPGLRVSSNSGRVRGFVDYALSGLGYIKSPVRDQFQNALSASVMAEVIDNWAFVDVTGSITQQAISAFGSQVVDGGQGEGNRAEVWTVSVSPSLRGTLGTVARYNARLTMGATNTRKSSLADATNTGMQIGISGVNARSLLTWSLDGALQRQSFKEGRSTSNDNLRGTLRLAAFDDLLLSANAGVDSSNLRSSEREQKGTYGIGLNWTPTERTKLSLQRDQRFFGESHSVTFEHRMARSIWRFSDSKDVSNYTGQSNGGGQGTNYELFFALFASQVPDPAQRQVYVMDYLRNLGLSPTASAAGGFLSSAASVVRRQELSLALSGVRDTVTLLVSRTENRRLDSLSRVQDDLSDSDVVRQTGLSLGLSHRLTPQSSANLTLSQQNTSGALTTQSTTMRSILANWTANLGARTSVSLGARYVVFHAERSPYTEKALFANLNRQF